MSQGIYKVGISSLDSFPGPYLNLRLEPIGLFQQMPTYYVIVKAGPPAVPDLPAFSQDPASLRIPDRPFALRGQDGKPLVVSHATEAINLFAQMGWELVEINPNEYGSIYWLKKKT